MNLSKSREIFEPAEVKEKFHIIGCGSVGSSVAELLARFGLTKFTLYDFDRVESKNIVNQMFTYNDIGKLKVEALRDIIVSINPEASNDIKLQPDGYEAQPLAGYVILAVDNIELRKKIVEANKQNRHIKAIFDFRTGLYDAQHYAADWSKSQDKEFLLNTMQFTHEDAQKETPVSACGTVLGVAPTVRSIATAGVVNIFNFIKFGKLNQIVSSNPFEFSLLGFGQET